MSSSCYDAAAALASKSDLEGPKLHVRRQKLLFAASSTCSKSHSPVHVVQHHVSCISINVGDYVYFCYRRCGLRALGTEE